MLLGAERGYHAFRMHSVDPTDGSGHVADDDETPYFPTGQLWQPSPATTTVPVATVDQLVADKVIDPPTVIKIDTEGFEGLILQDAGEV